MTPVLPSLLEFPPLLSQLVQDNPPSWPPVLMRPPLPLKQQPLLR